MVAKLLKVVGGELTLVTGPYSMVQIQLADNRPKYHVAGALVIEHVNSGLCVVRTHRKLQELVCSFNNHGISYDLTMSKFLSTHPSEIRYFALPVPSVKTGDYRGIALKRDICESLTDSYLVTRRQVAVSLDKRSEQQNSIRKRDIGYRALMAYGDHLSTDGINHLTVEDFARQIRDGKITF